MRLLILTNNPLFDDKVSSIRQLTDTVEVVSDAETVASRVDRAMADAIIIVQDHEKYSSIVTFLRENTRIDSVPILTVRSIDEATRVILILLGQNL